jgi:hypothetical protein
LVHKRLDALEIGFHRDQAKVAAFERLPSGKRFAGDSDESGGAAVLEDEEVKHEGQDDDNSYQNVSRR